MVDLGIFKAGSPLYDDGEKTRGAVGVGEDEAVGVSAALNKEAKDFDGG